MSKRASLLSSLITVSKQENLEDLEMFASTQLKVLHALISITVQSADYILN